MLFLILKLCCLALYGLALASLAGLVVPAWAGTLANTAMAVLLFHALELVFAFKYVRLYRGPLAVSVALTLLFGLLHWKPLADAQARARNGTQQ